MLVTLPGIVTPVRLEQFLKAVLPMRCDRQAIDCAGEDHRIAWTGLELVMVIAPLLVV